MPLVVQSLSSLNHLPLPCLESVFSVYWLTLGDDVNRNIIHRICYALRLVDCFHVRFNGLIILMLSIAEAELL